MNRDELKGDETGQPFDAPQGSEQEPTTPPGGATTDAEEIDRLKARIAELELEKATAQMAARQATQALTLTRGQFVRLLEEYAAIQTAA